MYPSPCFCPPILVGQPLLSCGDVATSASVERGKDVLPELAQERSRWQPMIAGIISRGGQLLAASIKSLALPHETCSTQH